MPVSVEALENKLKGAIPVNHLEIVDQSNGCGENYKVVVVSELFDNKQYRLPLARHRLVNDLLRNEISQMHAFIQVPLTPKQYEARLASGEAI